MTPLRFEIDIAKSDGDTSRAHITCEVEYRRENSFIRPLCTVWLNWETYDFCSTADDFFRAFCRIRERLETIGASPHCYAASRNVRPSGLQRDMGLGLKAYKLTVNKRSSPAEVVRIFECGSDLEIVTVAEQDRFYQEWLESQRNLYTENL